MAGKLRENMSSVAVSICVPPWVMAYMHGWLLPISTFAFGVTFAAACMLAFVFWNSRAALSKAEGGEGQG